MNIGDTVYFLYDYNLEKGVVVSVGPKNLRIEMQILGSDSKNQPYEVKQSRVKCAAPDESIAVIWELWKDSNGRGGYRLKRVYVTNLGYVWKGMWLGIAGYPTLNVGFAGGTDDFEAITSEYAVEAFVTGVDKGITLSQ